MTYVLVQLVVLLNQRFLCKQIRSHRNSVFGRAKSQLQNHRRKMDLIVIEATIRRWRPFWWRVREIWPFSPLFPVWNGEWGLGLAKQRRRPRRKSCDLLSAWTIPTTSLSHRDERFLRRIGPSLSSARSYPLWGNKMREQLAPVLTDPRVKETSLNEWVYKCVLRNHNLVPLFQIIVFRISKGPTKWPTCKACIGRRIRGRRIPTA